MTANIHNGWNAFRRGATSVVAVIALFEVLEMSMCKERKQMFSTRKKEKNDEIHIAQIAHPNPTEWSDCKRNEIIDSDIVSVDNMNTVDKDKSKTLQDYADRVTFLKIGHMVNPTSAFRNV